MADGIMTDSYAWADLNGPQREAATHGMGPLLIIAGAGTGKTTTLAHRVAHLVTTGIDPGRILLLTFTRRAASEMLRRVDSILREMNRESVSRKIWGGTFHAVATRLLRQHGKRIGLAAGFTIVDRTDSEDLMQVVRSDLGFGEAKRKNIPITERDVRDSIPT
ncbi:MAG: UvrD-helicase domain-containing protein [Planctomycetaceae bacterium]